MAVKFNSDECCHDSVFNEELPSKCKKATVHLFNINVIQVMWVWFGRGHVNWGRGNYRMWFVPEVILEKLEPIII